MFINPKDSIDSQVISVEEIDEELLVKYSYTQKTAKAVLFYFKSMVELNFTITSKFSNGKGFRLIKSYNGDSIGMCFNPEDFASEGFNFTDRFTDYQVTIDTNLKECLVKITPLQYSNPDWI